MHKLKCFKFLFLFLFLTKMLIAQEERDDASLNYTYIGPIISAAYNQVEYRDWFGTSTETKKMSGYSFSGGFAFDIFARNLCGDFQLKYTYSQLDFALTFVEYSMSGKYLYYLNEYISAGAGFGFYFESPPSNKDHNGSAGLQLPLTAVFNTSSDSKLFIDLFSRYGTFGLGQNSKVISVGINVGFIYKVGRI